MPKNDVWEKYIKENVIASGSYTNIYKAIHKKTGNFVAIKEVNKNKLKLFYNIDLNENENYKIILNNENSIEIKEIIQTKENIYIIMDYCFCNLEDFIKMNKKNISISNIQKILNQINNCFKIVLKNNIIYKDLKPSNILLSLNEMNEIDFKLSNKIIKRLNNNSSQSKKDINLTVSPELIKGETVTNKSDIWSLGIIIYYLYFKEYPYKGKREYQVLKDIESNKELKIINDNDLNDLVRKMLIIDVKKRISWEDYFNHIFFKKKIIEGNQFNLICKQHSQQFNSYCSNCKSNICNLCLNEHESHKIVSFLDIGLTHLELKQLENLINELNDNIENLNKIYINMNDLLNKMKLIEKNNSIYENNLKNNYKQYYIDYLSNINKQIKILDLINFNTLENTIICEYCIQKSNNNDDLNRQILNYKNKNELEEKCDLYLNDKRIDFCSTYKFPENGKYIIKLKFKKNIADISDIFSNCTSLISIDLSNFNTSNLNNMNNMFYNCSSLTSLNLSNFKSHNIKYMDKMFFQCSSLNSIDLSNFNGEIEYFIMILNSCKLLKSLNLSNFNSNYCDNMSNLFSKCSSLTSLNLSNFNTNKINDMSNMFYNCSSLTSLNLSNFNTSNVNNMSYMFSNCSSLTSLDLSNFNTSNVINMSNMFSNCSSLTLLNISNFNINNVKYKNDVFINLNKNCKVIYNDEK